MYHPYFSIACGQAEGVLIAALHGKHLCPEDKQLGHFAAGALEDTNITLLSPAAAALPAREEAALPVLAHATVSAPASLAFTTATAEALSFRLEVGF